MRIIAGLARGRKFSAPTGKKTRPTLDRVREAMFGMIQFEVPSSRVLDLFSGSGALGLEAASRGAQFCLLNDADPVCAELIRKNAEALGLAENIKVSSCDYSKLISDLGIRGLSFDLVFIDAPYRKGMAEDAIRLIGEHGILSDSGTIVWEHSKDEDPIRISAPYRVVKTKNYGECAVSLILGELRK